MCVSGDDAATAAGQLTAFGGPKNNAGKAKRMSVISEDTLQQLVGVAVGAGNMIWPRYWPRHKSHVNSDSATKWRKSQTKSYAAPAARPNENVTAQCPRRLHAKLKS